VDKKHSRSRTPFCPETLALGYAYDPFLSEGAVKPPVFLTSTFQFKTAEEGKRFFEIAYGLRQGTPSEAPGLIYSRLNNPDLEIFERRLAVWDGTERAAVFSSGMAAISTTMLGLLKPGEHVISTSPVYGGTHYLLEHILPRFGITTTQILGGTDAPARMKQAAQEVGPERVRLLFVETPANPSNTLVDIAAVAKLARELSSGRERPVITVVDNTFLGPVFQQPARLGADLVVYSATKFLGGHSDLIAGLVSGPEGLLSELMVMRTILGTMATPFSGWLLLRSLETLSVRMNRQSKSARVLARVLASHSRVRSVHFPGLLQPGDPQHEIYQRQCSGPGSLIAFEVEGGEAAAQRVLNAFEVARLAVSLGGTETLVEHPMTMTHADVPPDALERMGVSAGLVRISVGLEHVDDLKTDLLHALEAAWEPSTSASMPEKED
jgi:methionine-gamma-lyase